MEDTPPGPPDKPAWAGVSWVVAKSVARMDDSRAVVPFVLELLHILLLLLLPDLLFIAFMVPILLLLVCDNIFDLVIFL